MFYIAGLATAYPIISGKKQEADELAGDASVEEDSFVKVIKVCKNFSHFLFKVSVWLQLMKKLPFSLW